ncbi:MAG: exodeoxyribonuclease VII large subunit [Anaerolineales bacterium]|nr:exodeoxyribonuclease VII large subunit [Anaerolineales bacterium]
MVQPSLFPPSAWTVTEVNRYLRDLLESDHNLGDLWVQGEISNLSRPRSGHIYFTVKDDQATLRCVMWRNTAQRLAFLPKDGDSVEVHGSVSVYEAGGQYQLYADAIKPLGEGALFQEFTRLKAKLEAEGLFDEDRKRPLPRWPKRIGIVTSPTGAALRDMNNTLRRRYPLVEVIIAPTSVQGRDAPAGIVAGLHDLNRATAPDVILLARGGGSIEDLWAFNDEGVARAIVDSVSPVITGVGHETDFTIADFVADLRAPTPTAAAELATPNRADLLIDLNETSRRFAQIVRSEIDEQRWQLNELAGRLKRLSPEARIHNYHQRLDELSYRLLNSLSHYFDMQRVHLNATEQRLTDLNPQSVLSRGYAVVTESNGRNVRSVEQVSAGDSLHVQVSDGEFNVEAKD